MKKLVSLLLTFCACLSFSVMFASCTHEHAAGDWEVTIQATCSMEGKRERLCDCGESMEAESIPINPNNHADRSYVVTEPATCQASGLQDEHCLGCAKVLQTNVVIPQDPNLHLFDILTNSCTVCGEKELPEITSLDQEEAGEPRIIILLDYVLDTSRYWTLTFDSNTEYIRFVGTAGKEYPLSIKIADRETPISFDFVNTTIYGTETATISSDADTAVNLGFYGKKSGIKGANGTVGTDGGPFRDAGAGKIAVDISGELFITVGGASCSICGGNGGRGGNGSIGNDGGRGGDGAMAISAGSIKISIKEGYTKDNLFVAGGSGGVGGSAGGWFFGTPSDGASGNAAVATNVDILYQ